MTKTIFLILVLFLTLFYSVKAQDTLYANLPKQWHLEDCIDYAIKNNISLATLRLSAKLSDEDLLLSKASKLPNLSGSMSQSLVNSNNANLVVGGFQTQASLSSNYGINSSLVLYNAGYLKNDIRSKELSVQSLNLILKETENNLTLSITQAFFNILLAREIMVSLEAVLATSKELLKQGQQKLSAGGIAKKDVLQLESQVALDQYNLINATNNYKLNTVVLKQFLYLPTTFNFEVFVTTSFPEKQILSPLSEVQSLALQARPEIKNKEVLVQKSEVELEKMRAATKPSISMGAGLATGFSNNQSFVYLSQLKNNFFQSLGLTMGVPIYSRRVNKTNINKSKILVQQSQLALYDTKTILNQQIEQTYINLLNAQAQFIAAEIQLKKSEEIYQISTVQLQLGGFSTVELLLQRNAYVQALQLLAQAKYRVALYDKIYAFYSGVSISF